MIRFQWLRPVAAGAGAILALVACGSTGGGGGGTKGTIEIGVEMPLSGTDASQGQPILNGVQLAVQNHSTVNGYKIQVKSFDDSVQGTHDPAKGAQNVQAMVGDSKVLGMVGPLNSNVAKAEIPIASDANLVMVSPGNTNECLTRDDLDCNGEATQLRKGNPNSYFRLVTIDTYQGPGAAYYMYQQLHVTKVAIGSDNETYGKGIADSFQKQFEQLGGTVVQRKDFDWKTTDNFQPFLQAAKDGGAQGVYWGGVTATKSCIPRAQMKTVGFPATTPYMGGDGIVTDPNCAKDAGDQAPGVYATIAAVDPAHVAGAKSVISQYDSKYGQQNRTGYSIIAYDCAGVLLDAISKAIDANNGNMPKRSQVRDAMGKENYSGILGPVSFDSHGDTKVKLISVYEYTSADPNQAANSPWKGAYDFGQTPPKFES
jgi:branched-chain amino acid transport system substrate-binding protein